MKQILWIIVLALALAAGIVMTLAPLQGNAAKSPTFRPATGSPIPAGPMAGEPAIGDCNNDGHPDIIVACGTCCGSRPSPQSGHVLVLLGDGKGGFTRAGGSPIPVGPSVRKVALGDLNGDRNLDIAVAQHDSYEVVILLGDGKGGFRPAPTSPVTAARGPRAHTHDIVIGDVNGDHKPDVLTTNAGDNTISVLLGDGKGGLAPAEGSPVPAGRHPYDVVALHDVNGADRPDNITPNLRGNAVSVLLGNGRGGFAPATGSPFPLGPRPGYVTVADFNRDGKPDIVATHDDDPLMAVLLGDGKGGFAPAPASPLKTAHPVWGTAAGDLNGDGHPDLALGTSNGNFGILIMLGDGKGGFAPAAGGPLPAGGQPGYVAMADLNKDGKLDVVSGNYGSGDVTVLLNVTR